MSILRLFGWQVHFPEPRGIGALPWVALGLLPLLLVAFVSTLSLGQVQLLGCLLFLNYAVASTNAEWRDIYEEELEARMAENVKACRVHLQ